MPSSVTVSCHAFPCFRLALTPFSLGLGGTSLINANVYLEADKDTLALEAWPKEIRENTGALEQCTLFFLDRLRRLSG